MAVPDHDTMDMFPDMPRDPRPNPEDDMPQDVQDTVKALRKMKRERHRPLEEQMQLEQAAKLLVEAWTGGTP